MATLVRTLPLIPPQEPRLLAAPIEYSAQYQEQYSNTLRLYFNQLQNFFLLLTSNPGGAFIQFPYGAFHQNGSTTLSANITNVSTTPISVASTAAFPSSGWILIQSELIAYTGKTSTTFTGITRGVLGTTNVAHTAGEIGRAHV